MISAFPSSSEVETVLIVRDNPEEVLRNLAGLRSILNYRLKLLPPKTIHDTYFDTAKRSLQKKRINLRIREINGAVFISVKSGAKLTQGGIRRKETELPWSNGNLARTARELHLKRLAETNATQSPDLGARGSLVEMGLQVTQERQTRREVRDITSELDPTGLVLAELALDRVTYHFQHEDVSIFEVEVEAKAKNSALMVRDVTEKLLSTYNPMLQRWTHGKFVTGNAIGRLLRTGVLQGLLNDSVLRPEGLDSVDHFIRSRNF